MSSNLYPMQVYCNGKETVGSCQIEFYTNGAAIFRGVKMFVLVLFGAICSIVLPGLHFVTVPLGVLASPLVGIYFFFISKGAVKRTDGEFVCPECQATNHVTYRAGTPPYVGNCVQCQHHFEATPLLESVVAKSE